MRHQDNAEDLFVESYQARNIIERFGGVPALVSALEFVGYKISRFSIYKWTYPKKRSGHGGTGGFIPADAIPWVKKAAEECGVKLTNGDWK